MVIAEKMVKEWNDFKIKVQKSGKKDEKEMLFAKVPNQNLNPLNVTGSMCSVKGSAPAMGRHRRHWAQERGPRAAGPRP